MDQQGLKQRACAFLDEQMRQIAAKHARFQRGVDLSDSCCAERTQTQLAHSAALELALLRDLRRQCADANVSLDAQIIHYQQTLARRAARLAQQWQRGKPTPAPYWDIEAQRNFLGDLLARYHGWRANSRSNGAKNGSGERSAASNGHFSGLFPWYSTKTKRNHCDITELDRAVTGAVDKLRLPECHVHWITQPDGLVLLTGYLHSTDDCERAIDTILATPGVSEVLVDIRTRQPATCPCCQQV